MRPDRIPLFPLNVVLFPGAALPLHIFEPRYRRMVKRCIKERAEFGVLLALKDGMARVGCTAEIVKVVKRYEDGRLDIVTSGRALFRILELYTDDPLLEGAVEYLEDQEGRIEPEVARELIELYEACYALIFSDYPRDVDEHKESDLAYYVASTLPMDLLWKQQILELRDEPARQQRLVMLLREWAPHLQRAELSRLRAGGDGHVSN